MTELADADVILSGVVGSQAYGLATPSSDVDTVGVFVAPFASVIGLDGPKAIDETITNNGPDYQYHEVGKFCRLALDMNPTVVELLWIDDELYRDLTEAGFLLVSARSKFLSKRALHSYGGYAVSQARKLVHLSASQDPGKRARHATRLLIQAEHLLTYGEVLVRLDTAQVQECRDATERAESGLLASLAAGLEARAHALETMPTSLPDKPDREYVNNMLTTIRTRRAKIETWR